MYGPHAPFGGSGPVIRSNNRKEIILENPLTHGEFQEWQQNHFLPHLEEERSTNSSVERLSVAVFGDGNGNTGIHSDVKSLMSTSDRIDAWLDGAKIIGKLTSWGLGIAASVVLLLKALGMG